MSGSRLDVDATSTTSTTSSGIKSSTELEMRAAKTATTTPLAPAAAGGAGGLGGAGGVAANPKLLAVAGADNRSEGSSSSSTEVENLHAPHTIKRRQQQQQQQPLDSFLVSDDEATLNEMIGKFDESYIYEKETDILR